MQQINCLNLCEILPFLQKKRNLPDILYDAMKEARFDSCERIYIGTSFCGKYFMNQSDASIKELLKLCMESNIRATLVIPTFSEGDLEPGKKRISQILQYSEGIIDEMTVNDYGMLSYIRQLYEQAINLGRLFMKDYRDPRYEEYFQIPWKPKMFTNYLKEILKEYEVRSCEFDLTHKNMIFSDVPADIVPGIHAPYCYQTVGRICEYASISKDISNKFRTNDICEINCTENQVKYLVEDGNVEYLRYGRTVYFKHPGYELHGLGQYRLIYFPIDLKAKMEVHREGTGSV